MTICEMIIQAMGDETVHIFDLYAEDGPRAFCFAEVLCFYQWIIGFGVRKVS